MSMNHSLVFMGVLSFAEVAFAVSQKPEIAIYRKKTQNLLRIVAQGASNTEIRQAASDVVASGKPIVESYRAKNPACKDYLEATLRDSDSMQKLSQQEIEEHYHSGSKLPKSPQKGCYNAKDLIVHPATVVVIAKGDVLNEKSKSEIQHEMNEVLHHLDMVAKDL